ncbi:metallopeptidase family protein [Streptomyces sp. AC495_CC817]|uniref:metallopeptidase family protein n=1 Tax=Streptomyces sp. AC495_CC817 TaxID=2823900 RepID=UPI001C27C68E|nr:metallopeptidase family protein [Streptomyces sp. AC495_CC817]
MHRRRVRTPDAPRRGARHGRHGRLGRSEVVRPPLAPLDGRIDRFDLTVGTAVEFLRGTWPELEDVRFEIGAMPAFESGDEVPRWHLDREGRRIVLFRLPIERLLPPGHDDASHRRMAIESAVFRAAAEYVGREPWDLGHDH